MVIIVKDDQGNVLNKVQVENKETTVKIACDGATAKVSQDEGTFAISAMH